MEWGETRPAIKLRDMFFQRLTYNKFKWLSKYLTLSLLSIRKGCSLCPNPFKGVTLQSESFEGCRGSNNCFLKCPSVSISSFHMEALSSFKESMQRIMGARSVHQMYPSKSFITKGPLKWLVLSTSVWNDPSIWRP